MVWPTEIDIFQKYCVYVRVCVCVCIALRNEETYWEKHKRRFILFAISCTKNYNSLRSQLQFI